MVMLVNHKIIKTYLKALIFTFIALLPTISYAQQEIRVGNVINEIRIGDLAGNRNLAFGVRNIVEELLLDLDYDLTDTADLRLDIKLIFFDIRLVGKNIAVYNKKEAITEIVAIGELYNKDKLIKKTTKKGESKEISTSTLVIASDGTFNQQTASIALKKLCESIVKELIVK
jgi:hypothetical protein